MRVVLDHRRSMGSSIWEYLWLLAHVAAEDLGGNGKSPRHRRARQTGANE